MREQGSAGSTMVSASTLAPRFATATLALVGFTWFVSGLFVLAAAGTAYPWLTYAFILASAAALSLPLLLITLLVAASEAVLGRAWANGLRRLEPRARRRRGTAARGLRYAAILWLANGAAFWFATVVAQF